MILQYKDSKCHIVLGIALWRTYTCTQNYSLYYSVPIFSAPPLPILSRKGIVIKKWYEWKSIVFCLCICTHTTQLNLYRKSSRIGQKQSQKEELLNFQKHYFKIARNACSKTKSTTFICLSLSIYSFLHFISALKCANRTTKQLNFVHNWPCYRQPNFKLRVNRILKIANAKKWKASIN